MRNHYCQGGKEENQPWRTDLPLNIASHIGNFTRKLKQDPMRMKSRTKHQACTSKRRGSLWLGLSTLHRVMSWVTGTELLFQKNGLRAWLWQTLHILADSSSYCKPKGRVVHLARTLIRDSMLNRAGRDKVSNFLSIFKFTFTKCQMTALFSF